MVINDQCISHLFSSGYFSISSAPVVKKDPRPIFDKEFKDQSVRLLIEVIF